MKVSYIKDNDPEVTHALKGHAILKQALNYTVIKMSFIQNTVAKGSSQYFNSSFSEVSSTVSKQIFIIREKNVSRQ